MTFKRDTSVPRVEIPGMSDEDRARAEALREEMDWYERTRSQFLRALFIQTRGRPFIGARTPRKPRRKPTKHQRHMASVKARSAYLKTQEA